MYQHRVDVFAERMLGYTLDAKQMEILGCGYDEIQMLWSRQTGKTELVAMIAAHGAVFDMPLTLIVSGGERQAQIVQDRVTEHVRRLGRDSEAEWQDLPHHSGYAPADVFAERIEIVRCSARLLQLGNDHRVVSAPASPATIRGFSPHRIIMDECAYVHGLVYEAIRPMRAVTAAQLICSSSAGAQQGWFWDWWNQSDDGRFKSEYRADECLRITQREPAFLPRERARLTPAIYGREYENKFLPAQGTLLSAGQLGDIFDYGVLPLAPELEMLSEDVQPFATNGHSGG